MSGRNDTESVTILLVDDSDTDRTLAAGLLTGERPDWIVLPEPSAASGLNVLSRRPVTVVVTDLYMPVMTGTEFLQEVRERFPSLPVILITSQGNDQIAARSLDLGAVNYVPKRLLAENLVPAIDEVLRTEREADVARSVLEHLQRSRVVIRIDNDLDDIRSLVNVIRERLRGLQKLDEESVRQVTGAVREGLMNAYFHGNLASNTVPLEHSRDEYIRLSESRRSELQYAGRSIELELTHEKDRVCFSITDDGSGFDTSVLSELTGDPSDDHPCGNGFRTMQQSMHCIEFNETGNQIVMIRQLDSQSST